MDYEMSCTYSEPVNLGTEENPSWAYSKADCILPDETIELIQNSTTGAEFYITKKLDYGDIIIWSFLAIFLIFGILKFITDFLIPKLVNFRRK